MDFLKNAGKHPPGEDEEPKAPRPPGTKEPEPDTPDPEDESPVLITPVQVRSDLRSSL